MKAVYMAGCLFLALFLVSCGGWRLRDRLGREFICRHTAHPRANHGRRGGIIGGGERAHRTCNWLRADSRAQIEFWLADSQGIYDDARRATMLAGEGGEYRFQSNFPGLYENRPPHLHVRVAAPGYEELVTQHYPEAGQTEAIFDLVLVPA